MFNEVLVGPQTQVSDGIHRQSQGRSPRGSSRLRAARPLLRADLPRNMFSVCNQAAVTTTTSLNTTFTGLAVANPAGSGYNLVINKFTCAQFAVGCCRGCRHFGRCRSRGRLAHDPEPQIRRQVVDCHSLGGRDHRGADPDGDGRLLGLVGDDRLRPAAWRRPRSRGLAHHPARLLRRLGYVDRDDHGADLLVLLGRSADLSTQQFLARAGGREAPSP
jgi:hypothetical protein